MRRRTIDIAFPGRRLALFVDGCFWHACPEHATWPKANGEFWREKIMRNRARDLESNRHLEDTGRAVLRIWEHTSIHESAAIVESCLDRPASRADESSRTP